ncbi:activator of HSP90 ATPase [Actinoallomurus iriomotensis]|uniref:Activator of HSP90 ATPase n=1 Tax=Actinoallomurus iriomotensis TaxID=478107 RepID=A0A9W6RRS7_9ACTN|nr:activator of HSP90 ATPase [Actinoallomurus iriomotensis]
MSGARTGRRTTFDEERGRYVIDIVSQVNATHREIGDLPVATGEGRSLLLRRGYDAPVEDVWNACTDPGRIGRWLAPIEGDLRLGGTYRLRNNAGGEILHCEEPRLLKVTWCLGEGMETEVEVRLAPDGEGGAILELEHASPAEIVDELVRAYGPGGTVGIGCGWDLALLGLDLFLHDVEFDPATWGTRSEAREFATRSCHAWGAAIQAAWGTSDEDLAVAVAFGVHHYAPSEGDNG